MKRILIAGMAALALMASSAFAEVRGNYIESRNAEIYASHCFANAELGIRGNLAVMAWQVESGAMNGVSLDGLSVVAVVKASSTLGDPFGNPLPAKAMLVIDEKATADQRAALETLVRRSAGELAADIVHVETAPISVDFQGNIHARHATLTAGGIVKLTTREIRGTDSLCHLDDIYYTPLVELDHAMPAFALESSLMAGKGLGVNLQENRRSSVYMGTFTMNGAQLSD